jgi:hypothetical protein
MKHICCADVGRTPQSPIQSFKFQIHISYFNHHISRPSSSRIHPYNRNDQTLRTVSNRLQAMASPLPAVPIAVLRHSQQARPWHPTRPDACRRPRSPRGGRPRPPRRRVSGLLAAVTAPSASTTQSDGSGGGGDSGRAREHGDVPCRPRHRHAAARAHGHSRHGRRPHLDAVRCALTAMAPEPTFDPLIRSSEITTTPARRSRARRRGGLRSSGEGGKVSVP